MTPPIHDREQAVQTVLTELTFSKQDGLSLPPTYEDQEVARRIVDALGIGQPDPEVERIRTHVRSYGLTPEGERAGRKWTVADVIEQAFVSHCAVEVCSAANQSGSTIPRPTVPVTQQWETP